MAALLARIEKSNLPTARNSIDHPPAAKSAAVGAGLTPMALSHAIGSEVQRPLAVVIIGGLFSAAALTLIVLPALYVMFEPSHEHADPLV